MLKFLFERNKQLFLKTFLFLVLYSAYNPVLSKLIQFDMNQAGKNNIKIVELIAINLFVLLILSLINLLAQYFSIQFSTVSQQTLNTKVMSKITEKDEYERSEVVKLFNNDIPLITESYLSSLTSIVYFSLSFIMGTVLILFINKIILLYICVVASLSLFVSKRMSNKISPSQKKYNDSLGENSELLLDIFELSIIRKVFHLDKIMNKKFKEASSASTRNLFTLKKEKAIVTFSNDTFSWVLQIGIYIIGAILLSNKQITFPELIAITQASGTVTTPIFWFSNVLSSLASTKDIRKVMMNLINEKSETNTKKISQIETIKLENVVLNNKKTNRNALNLSILKNNKYLLLGENGSGKTTLYSLLSLRNRDYEGSILINDTELRQINPASYRKQIAIVTQQTKLFSGTVLENIVGFSNDINKSKVEKIRPLFQNEAKTIFDCPAHQLSGGQKQLVTIARAIYKDSDYLFLDEPFSALDVKTKKLALLYLLELTDKTIVMTIHNHDDQLLKLFDNIIYI